jgi:hypothetical protein
MGLGLTLHDVVTGLLNSILDVLVLEVWHRKWILRQIKHIAG